MRHRLNPKLCPNLRTISARQALFVSIDDREAMYGGAAGGGKTDALLMAASQYVDLPNYRALILRRFDRDLSKGDSIYARAQDWWLRPGNGVRLDRGTKTFRFPSGASIEFGHCNNESDKQRYAGPAYHFIGFEELTQFTATQYVFFFSRNRRNKADEGLPPIPLRMRGGTNPADEFGKSMAFYRDRFMTIDFARAFIEDRAPMAYKRKIVREIRKGVVKTSFRWFVPSKVEDNPGLDVDSYIEGMRELDPVTQARLLKGDWLISASGRFKPEWFRRFLHPDLTVGDNYLLLQKGSDKVERVVHPNECTRLMIIDAAGTAADAEAKSKGKLPSWSVVSTFDITPGEWNLLWRRVNRFQKEFADVIDDIEADYRRELPRRIVTETDGIGAQVYSALARRGIPIEGIGTGGRDKLARSASASVEAKEGRVWLPQSAPWLDDCEAELFTWQGLKDEVADQIDTLSYAAILKVEDFAGSTLIEGRTW